MESLLKDMLPDRPRDAAILVAAAEHGLAAILRERVSQEGMDTATAIRLVAAIFAKATAFTPEACEWAVTELAIAMGMDVPSPATRPAPDQPATPLLSAVTAPPPGMHGQPTGITVPPPDWVTAPDAGAPLPGRETIAAPPAFAAPPGYGNVGFPPPPTHQPRRRAAWLVAGGVAAVVIAVAAVFVLHKSPLPTPAITVSAATANNAVDGNVYVYYRVKGLANATITATVSHGTKGEVAELTAQPYPFTAPPTAVASAKITGAHQRLSFPQVAPSLATRYRVKIVRSSGASSALATSPARTVYVALIAHYRYRQKTCPRPQCFVTIVFTVPVAQAALRAELAKHVYVYWGINLRTRGPEPPDPTTLKLQEQLRTTDPTGHMRRGVYKVTLAFKFTVNQDAFRYHWNICTKADVSADGIGLPGPSQCGNPSISAQHPGYLGSLAG
jgi:hypothetical protein